MGEERKPMNTSRVRSALDDIERNRAALAWLEEYGVKIDGRDRNATLSPEIFLASSCNGAKEARQVIAAYATLALPEIIKTSIESCRNTIAIAEDAIREELSAIPSKPRSPTEAK